MESKMKDVRFVFIFGMTLVMLLSLTLSGAVAQDGEPTPPPEGASETAMPLEDGGLPKQLPAVTELGESVAIQTSNRHESEPNNSFGPADSIGVGDVMAGKIGRAGDVDYFRFTLDYRTNILVDIEAQAIGSHLDSVVCLFYEEYPDAPFCNDDTDTPDSLLFYHLDAGTYYLSLSDYWGVAGGSNFKYRLLLSSPLLVSAASDGTVAGIPFQSADVLAHSELNTGAEKWVMFFDASDVGISTNLWNVTSYYPFGEYRDNILVGLATNQNVANVGRVTAWDIIAFDPYRYGPSTKGQFFLEQKGKNVQLTVRGEKIDALVGFCEIDTFYQGWPLSTVGTAGLRLSSGKFRAKDEDLFIPVSRGEDVWPEVMIGSSIPGLAAEDVVAAAAEHRGYSGYYPSGFFLTIKGSGNIDGTRVTQKDIFVVNHDSSGGNADPWGVTFGGVVWHGPDHGWNYNIDAIDLTQR
jgi:hypothetical protein